LRIEARWRRERAFGHLQLDIYGELLDSLYLHDKYEMWNVITVLLDWVAKNWEQPDQKIWEVRGGRRHFAYSKMQCRGALDRGLRLATKRSLPSNVSWQTERDRIYEAINTRSWNEEIGACKQYFGSNAYASCPLMPLMRFVSPTDRGMVSTIRAITH
jgi:GH15 family glucan-1,4-alpha-glucosidase